MEEITPYRQARVLLAAIVLAEHRSKKQANIRTIAELSTFSEELVHHLVNKLEDLGAVRRIAGPFEDGVTIEDETAIEALRDEEFSANIDDEVVRFAERQKAKQSEIDKLFKGDDENKKDLRSSLEEQLKAGGKQKKENPLDAITGDKKDKDD